MTGHIEPPSTTRAQAMAAVCVHIFTASGAAIALLAMLAVIDGAYERAFF